MKWFHRHKWEIKKIKYPIKMFDDYGYVDVDGRYIGASPQLVSGTAIISECKCGERKIEKLIGKYELFEENIVRTK